jgi:hypothetical protein
VHKVIASCLKITSHIPKHHQVTREFSLPTDLKSENSILISYLFDSSNRDMNICLYYNGKFIASTALLLLEVTFAFNTCALYMLSRLSSWTNNLMSQLRPCAVQDRATCSCFIVMLLYQRLSEYHYCHSISVIIFTQELDIFNTYTNLFMWR